MFIITKVRARQIVAGVSSCCQHLPVLFLFIFLFIFVFNLEALNFAKEGESHYFLVKPNRPRNGDVVGRLMRLALHVRGSIWRHATWMKGADESIQIRVVSAFHFAYLLQDSLPEWAKVKKYNKITASAFKSLACYGHPNYNGAVISPPSSDSVMTARSIWGKEQ